MQLYVPPRSTPTFEISMASTMPLVQSLTLHCNRIRADGCHDVLPWFGHHSSLRTLSLPNSFCHACLLHFSNLYDASVRRSELSLILYLDKILRPLLVRPPFAPVQVLTLHHTTVHDSRRRQW
ncbi:hypothetical protein BD311DRAFT_755943 [Dichomitus squalens]|uniref:Uncharacterized protein n=1 Tax=Dichomitus squalens TaxID=114155 RepID=A0A4Q9MQ33_9APHY|nr:hypothetical protein BD311DRAFT_755943 [Dichomitus squalens]